MWLIVLGESFIGRPFACRSVMPAFAAAWIRRISSTFRFLNSSTKR
jgi:hypothetical protein